MPYDISRNLIEVVSLLLALLHDYQLPLSLFDIFKTHFFWAKGPFLWPMLVISSESKAAWKCINQEKGIEDFRTWRETTLHNTLFISINAERKRERERQGEMETELRSNYDLMHPTLISC